MSLLSTLFGSLFLHSVGVIRVKQAKHFLVKSGALGFRNFDSKAFTDGRDTSAGSV